MRATFIADPEDFLHRLIEFAGDLEGRHQLERSTNPASPSAA
jgi:hypothetical protein